MAAALPPSPSPHGVPTNPSWSRRRFLRTSSALAALTTLPGWYLERQRALAAEPTPRPSANDRPGLALVGCGGMGKSDGLNASHYGDIVAVCDVDATRAAEAAEQLTREGRKPQIYADVRQLLERPDVHAIINATPDHWHTLINLAAARAGKDIYSEKPLTLTIDEGRHVVDTVRQHGTILQTGTQQRSNARFRLACELVRNGRLGQLRDAHVWLPAGLVGGPFATAPVPHELNWDFWLGQAPAVDYVPQRAHGTFRFWYDYSGGTMTDWGAHHNDIAYWAIGLVAPRKVESEAFSQPVPGGYTAFADYTVRYEYANGIRLHVHTTRDDSIYGAVVNPQGQRNGIRFEGTDGWIWVNRKGIEASDPELLRTPLPEQAVRLYESRDHFGNFFECLRSRQAPICDAETGHRSATMCHLGAISLRTGRALEWDSDQQRFVGAHADEANLHLSRPMRAPYDYSFGT